MTTVYANDVPWFDATEGADSAGASLDDVLAGAPPVTVAGGQIDMDLELADYLLSFGFELEAQGDDYNALDLPDGDVALTTTSGGAIPA